MFLRMGIALSFISLLSGQITAQPSESVRIPVEATMREERGLSKHLSYYVGGFQPNYLEVRKGQRVTIQLTSKDGTHSLAIPGLALKTAPVAPGMSNELTFVADQVGDFEIKCDTVCGKLHRQMGGRLVVTEPDQP